MDIDRRRAEAAEYNRKPRLVELNEIPPAIINQSRRFAEDDEPDGTEGSFSGTIQSGQTQLQDLGRRKRKEVDYSQDLMSDREWLKQIDDALDNDDEQPHRKKPRKYAFFRRLLMLL